jgi:hypothetical protein
MKHPVILAPLGKLAWVYMKLLPLISLSALLMTACGSVEWVHPNKPKDEFTVDYNKCHNESLLNPKNQQGNNYLVLQATERCLAKKGWVLREKSG